MMNKKALAVSLSAIVLMAPLMAFAKFNPGPEPSGNPNLDIIDLITKIFDFIWPLAVAFMIIMFLLAGFLFMTAQGEPSKVAQARSALLWGMVGVVIVFLAFAIPFIVKNTLGL